MDEIAAHGNSAMCGQTIIIPYVSLTIPPQSGSGGGSPHRALWMDPAFLPYLACALGAVAVFLLLRPAVPAAKAAGIILGLAAFAGVLVKVADQMSPPSASPGRPGVFFLLFSLIAVAC